MTADVAAMMLPGSISDAVDIDVVVSATVDLLLDRV
jgi:hypothetical protein